MRHSALFSQLPAVAALVGLIASAAPAAAVELFAEDGWNGLGGILARSNAAPEDRIPACTDAQVQASIRSRFANAERNHSYYEGIDAIGAIDHVTEAGFTVNSPSPLARRYCAARAEMSDGRTRTLYYKIVEDGGFAGRCWEVEFCVRGLDRWHVYDAACRTVRPQ